MMDNYKIIEFDNIPLIKTSVINRVGYPYLGVGEAVAGPTGASISNAIRRALGERITTMPFTTPLMYCNGSRTVLLIKFPKRWAK